MKRTSLLCPATAARNSVSCTRTRKQPNGFTLMELLIVIAIILILMLMAIPTIGSLTKKGNETSAINSVQTVTKAEIQYQSSYPANGFACSLPALGGDPNAGAPTPAGAQILQGDLTSGYKSGYIFTITCTTRSPSTARTARTVTPSRRFRRPWARRAIAASAATSSAPSSTIRRAAPTAPRTCNEPAPLRTARRLAAGRRAALVASLRPAAFAVREGAGRARRSPLQPVALAQGRVL